MNNIPYFCAVFYSDRMIIRILTTLFIGSCICLFTGCRLGKPTSSVIEPDSVCVPAYAKGFCIEYYPSYKCVVVFNPWKPGRVQARYYVVSSSGVSTPDPAKTIVAPLHAVAATSASHYAFIAALNQLHSITGLSSPKLVYNPDLIKAYKSGRVVDLGDAFSLNVEKTMALKPQALMMSSYNQTDVAAERIARSGIPVLFNNEWMETTPLGRAEWVRFVAAFYNKEREATLLFGGLVKRYNAMKQLAAGVQEKPSVMVGGSFKGTWYMPSGKGYMGRMLADAGASYYFAGDTTQGSIPLNFEQALQHFSNAGVWLNCDAASLSALVKGDSRYALFKACKERQVYSQYCRVTATGGNDFWEGGVLHPDLILADFIKALHPALLPRYQMYYLKKLE